MIKIIDDVLSKIEMQEFIFYYEDNKSAEHTFDGERDSKIYKFKGISIIDNYNRFSFFKKIKYQNYDRLRIQLVDNSIEMVLQPHTHVTPYSFIIFLNEDFDGGDVIFDNVRVKPKKGQMIYFSGDQGHFVENILSGNRYTLIGFLKDNQFDFV